MSNLNELYLYKGRYEWMIRFLALCLLLHFGSSVFFAINGSLIPFLLSAFCTILLSGLTGLGMAESKLNDEKIVESERLEKAREIIAAIYKKENP